MHGRPRQNGNGSEEEKGMKPIGVLAVALWIFAAIVVIVVVAMNGG